MYLITCMVLPATSQLPLGNAGCCAKHVQPTTKITGYFDDHQRDPRKIASWTHLGRIIANHSKRRAGDFGSQLVRWGWWVQNPESIRTAPPTKSCQSERADGIPLKMVIIMTDNDKLRRMGRKNSAHMFVTSLGRMQFSALGNYRARRLWQQLKIMQLPSVPKVCKLRETKVNVKCLNFEVIKFHCFRFSFLTNQNVDFRSLMVKV